MTAKTTKTKAPAKSKATAKPKTTQKARVSPVRERLDADKCIERDAKGRFICDQPLHRTRTGRIGGRLCTGHERTYWAAKRGTDPKPKASKTTTAKVAKAEPKDVYVRALEVQCPTCDSTKGEQCVMKNGPSRKSHMTRVRLLDAVTVGPARRSAPAPKPEAHRRVSATMTALVVPTVETK